MNDRYSRQQDIVPRDRILETRATVIGVGAIGRQVAIQLTAIGVPCIQLVDFDTVEISNLASQGYLQADLQRPKVDATADFCRQMNHDLHIETVFDRYKRTVDAGNCVFICVDSIDTRRHLWQSLKDKVNFLCDGRMSAEVLRVVTASDESSRKYYPQTLFTAQEAYAGPCTAKTTIYCANIAAGFMLAQFTKYLRFLPVDADIQVNLLASEINVGDIA
jgi:sulfur carrier protein ThiS adenylyltransferase